MSFDLGLPGLVDQQQASESTRTASVAAREDFDHMIDRYQHDVHRLVRRMLGWPAETAIIDDIVQEVFLAAWIRRETFRGNSSQKTWLTSITLNKIRNYRRGRRVVAALMERISKGLSHNTANVSPEQACTQQERQALVRAAIAKLPASDREVIVLRYLEGNSISELARHLNLKRNTVDARLSRARRRLRQLLIAQGVNTTEYE